MLPIQAWRIYYADGSTFSSDDGAWADAPPFGVQCIVYYHVDDLRTIEAGIDHYVFHGEADGNDYKMGLWCDGDAFYRVITRARDGWKVTP